MSPVTFVPLICDWDWIVQLKLVLSVLTFNYQASESHICVNDVELSP